MTVFEIGRKYRFTMIVAVPGGWSDEQSVWTVAEMDGPLLKLKNGDRVLIVNSASWHFVSAEPSD